MAVYGIVWVLGALLAIYIPLVPYLIFTVGVVGWLLLVVEAVVAAPIMAVSFMLPANDEMGKDGARFGGVVKYNFAPDIDVVWFCFSNSAVSGGGEADKLWDVE